ncbi:MAG: dienelactone hydrolase family protein [Muribaculaceae bacterium]
MKHFLSALLAIAISIAAVAQEKFTKCELISDGDTLRYCAIAPQQVEQNKRYPLVVFLHGAGERGDDNEAQLLHGSQQFLNPVNREKYPCYVVFPQCPNGKYGAYFARPRSLVPQEMPIQEQPTAFIRCVHALIEKYLAEPNVDPCRVYVIGLSMGAMSTYDMVIRYPELFAAAVPICGSVNPERITDAVKHTKWSIYHGDADTTVPLDGSREAYRKLRAVGADVKYIEFPGVGHGSWNPAFSMPDFMSWLFAQSRH